jgi:hypothetical protein
VAFASRLRRKLECTPVHTPLTFLLSCPLCHPCEIFPSDKPFAPLLKTVKSVQSVVQFLG